MGRIIAVCAEKGGCGKSTVAVNLAAALGGMGRRVLLVDMDPQCNATTTLTDAAELSGGESIAAVLLDKADPSEVVRASVTAPGVDLLPAHPDLADAAVELVGMPGRDLRLRAALGGLPGYDFTIIDTAPGRGLLSLNALAAATEILIPLDPSRYALAGVESLLTLANDVRRFLAQPGDPLAPRLLGLVLNRVSRNRTHSDAERELRTAFGERLLAVVPAAVAIDAAGWANRPVVLADPTSAPSLVLIALAERIANHATTAANAA